MVASLAVLLVLFLVLDVRRTGDWRDEVTLYENALAQSKRAEVIRVNLAVRLLHLGRYDEGIRVLQELVSFSPNYRGAWHNLGDLYQAKGMNEKAIAAFEKAIRDDPFDAASLLNLGYLYDKQGRREAAVKMYLRATRVAPTRARRVVQPRPRRCRRGAARERAPGGDDGAVGVARRRRGERSAEATERHAAAGAGAARAARAGDAAAL